MSKLRSVSTAFWSDPFIEELTPSEKLLFLYLVTNEKTNMLGIYEASIKKISFETGINKETVTKALKGFESLNKVKYLNNYVILVNFMKHQNFNTNMKKSAIDIFNALPKDLKMGDLVLDRLKPSKAFETLLNHYGMVRKVEVEVEVEDEVEYEIEVKGEEEKHPLQIFINNLPNVSKLKTQLTGTQCEELLTLYSKDIIKSTLEAMENYKDTPKKYTSVLLTLKKWIKRDLEDKKIKGKMTAAEELENALINGI